MGKEWYWVTKSTKRSVIVEGDGKTTNGCMCAFFQFFDFHPFNFPNTINHQQEITFKSTSSSIPKGTEAPRNSLESEDGIVSSLSNEENFEIPKKIQIKTKRSKGENLNDLSSEISINSPGTKTPTLVARLMGLDLLPSENSPISNPKNHQGKKKIIIQTKPRNSIDSSEITRIPLPRKSDFDPHRLSLQIFKENNNEDFEVPRFSFSKSKIDQDAKELVKKIKESVSSRKIGHDITNIVKTTKDQLQTRDEFLGQFRIKNCPKKTSSKNSSNLSTSPRIRYNLDNKHKLKTMKTISKDQNTKPKGYVLKEEQDSRDKKLVSSKCKKDRNEKFSSKFKRNPQTSSSRVNDIKSNNKSKKTQPMSRNFFNINVTSSNLVYVKRELSPHATKIHQNKVSETQDSKLCSQLPSCSSQRYKQEETTTHFTQETSTNVIEDKFNGASIIGTHKPEFQYITEILNKIASKTATKTVSFNECFSSTQALDPSIFYHLEHSLDDKDRNFTTKNHLGHRWNRKLMFDLVEEVLFEILKQNGSKKRLCFFDGFCSRFTLVELEEKVWKRVEEFPCAKCDVLEDIDNLIDNQYMKKLMKVEGEEEIERLVIEIERSILDTLVHETVVGVNCYFDL